MALPPTLHRAYYRRRANPRLQVARHPPPDRRWRWRSACEAGSRWHRFALTADDVGELMEAAGGAPGGGIVLRVRGAARTEVADLGALSSPATFTLCYVEERVGGVVTLAHGGGGCSGTLAQMANPPIDFASADLSTTHVLGAAEADAGTALAPLAHMHNVSVLRGANLDCSPPVAARAHAYLRVAGAYHRHDPRLLILHNDLDGPPANATAYPGLPLPAVPKTFVNANGCRVLHGAAPGAPPPPPSYASSTFELNRTTLRALYEATGRLLYALDGLRLEPPHDRSPCVGFSRWRRAATSGACASETAPDEATRQAMAEAIVGSEPSADALVVDVEVRGACADEVDGASSVGARVSVGDACWSHVHPDTLSVYDVSEWPAAHPGGAAAITQFADGGGVDLGYPASHPMTRWADERRHLPLLGKLGDVIDFAHLPAELRTPHAAAVVGAQSGTPAPDGVEACGSPGEVGNDPAAANLYNFYLTGIGSPPDGFPADVRTTAPWQVAAGGEMGERSLGKLQKLNEHRTRNVHLNLRQGKNIVWTMVALRAADQLRQRVAWALYQVFVISDTSMKWNHHEAWQAYYDIFTRGAFGPFRDVLRQVAYSPMMATYLTFLDNKAQAYDGSYPDENFAREIMQLFTIGLWQLRDDGTRLLDERGAPIMTYTNDDIVTLSRAWTGFRSQGARFNLENTDGSASGGRNDVDPMQIDASWRDPFPKLDLRGGYVGDGYPECVDLPRRGFLRRGARLSYLGAEMSAYVWANYEGAHLVLDDPASALHQLLCDRGGGGRCQLRSEVDVPANLPCHGVECDVDTARVLHLVDGNVSGLFEWRRPACVEFPFYADPKLVTVINGGQRDMCADPRTVSAGSCCAIAGGSTPARGECRYRQERVSYATNAARCASASGSVCPTAGYSYRVVNLECQYKSRYLRHWTAAPCAVKAQVDRNGWVALVHEPYANAAPRRPSFALDNANRTKTSAIHRNIDYIANPFFVNTLRFSQATPVSAPTKPHADAECPFRYG